MYERTEDLGVTVGSIVIAQRVSPNFRLLGQVLLRSLGVSDLCDPHPSRPPWGPFHDPALRDSQGRLGVLIREVLIHPLLRVTIPLFLWTGP